MKTAKEAIKYLQEHELFFYASAVSNAIRELTQQENAEHTSKFSAQINRWLCDCLFYLYSDTETDEDVWNAVRNIIVEYRQLFGLSITDFTELPNAFIDDDFPPFSCDCFDVASFIYENTTKGNNYYLFDIEAAAMPVAKYDSKVYKRAMQELMEMKILVPVKRGKLVKRV